MDKYLKKVMSVVLCLSLCISAMLSGGVTAFADTATYDLADLEGYYKTQGRTALVDGSVMLDWSASGIEWTANCSGDVKVTLNATRMEHTDVDADGGLYFTVYVDGVMQAADLRMPETVDSTWISNSTNYPFHITALGDTTFTIATGLSEGKHTFAIYNQTEANMGAFGVKSITLNGEILDAPVDKELFVEFVGDSITAGHGVLNNFDVNAPLYEDATRGWPYLTAKALDADWSVLAVSGITAIDGIGWSGASSVNMQDVYPYEIYYSDKTLTHDFSVREPDVIVLGLGTNDCWTWVADRGNLTDDQKVSGFKTMLTHLRDRNPNAKIVWVYGMMSSAANDYILQAISEMGGAGNKYYSLELPTDRSGGRGHPSLAVQTTYAEDVSAFITKITTPVVQEDWEVPTEKPAYIGGGTSADPYLITNGAELYWAVTNENSGVHFKLANDIILNEMTVDAANGTVSSDAALKEWYTGGTAYFKGTLDGDNHVIKGLYIDHEYIGSTEEWNMGYGLISHANGAVIKNLGIESAYVKVVGGAASAFVGSIGNSGGNVSFENCYVGSDAYICGNQAGGLLSSGGGTKLTGGVKNCYSLATVVRTNTSYGCGGIYGPIWSMSASNFAENVYCIGQLYGLSGVSNKTNVFTTVAQNGCAQVSAENMQGEAGQANLYKLSDAFCMVGSGYPRLKSFVGRTGGEWSGFRDYHFEGAGTEESPWILSSAEELAHAIYMGGKEDNYYKLTADVYLNNIEKIDWTTGTVHSGYTPISWYSSAFKGHFDGNGHVVHGLYVNETINDSAWGNTGDALFPAFSSGSIKNVGVDDSFIQATNNAAAIVGYAGATAQRTIDNCYAGKNVTLKGYNAGGIYGSGDANMTITSCYSLATVDGGRFGGISGGWWSYKYSSGNTSHYISDCYTTTSKIQHNATKVENCVAGATAKGDAAINAYTSLSAQYVRIGNDYPTLKVFTSLSANAPWNGLGDTSYIVDGAGDSATNPYIIENAGQLAHAIYNNGGGKYYKLANDIYVNDVSGDWLSRENIIWLQPTVQTSYGAGSTYFSGYLDGNGYTVQGIYYPLDSTAKTAALVPVFGKGYIKNIGVRNSQIVSLTNSGGITAITQTTDVKEIDSCFVDDTVHIEFNDKSNPGGAGGIVGYAAYGSDSNPIKISNCYSAATLVSAYAENERSNGIVGISWKAYYTVENCYSLGYKPYHATSTNTTSKVTDAYTNVYTDSTVAPSQGAYTRLATDVIKSETALSSMTGLSDDIWYAVIGGGKAPMLRVYGTALGDVDENGVFELGGDATALRQALIGSAAYKNADSDKNGSVNILDLVALHNK